jgi:hypothetical protein
LKLRPPLPPLLHRLPRLLPPLKPRLLLRPPKPSPLKPLRLLPLAPPPKTPLLPLQPPRRSNSASGDKKANLRVGLFLGSSRFSGEGGLDLQEEIG